MLLRAEGFYAEGLLAAPTIADIISSGQANTSADPQGISTTGLSWTSGQTLISIIGTVGGAAVSSIAGNTDDGPGSSLGSSLNTTRMYMHEISVDGGSLDTTISADLSASSRICAFLLTLSSDLDAITTPTGAIGTGPTLPNSASFSVTGTKNRLLVAAIVVRGAHITNPPTAPSGYTLVGGITNPVFCNGTDNPTQTTSCTLAIATMAAPASSGTIPQADWGGLADIGTQVWAGLHFALEPA